MSTHEDFSRAEETKGSSDRTFGLVLTAFFALVAVWPALHHRPLRLPAAEVSAALLLISLAFPPILRPANKIWTLLAKLLNKVMNPIVTGLLFFFVFTPVAVILKLSGKDSLRRRFDPSVTTYWLPRDPAGPPAGTMINQF